jgi:hypothetical protein
MVQLLPTAELISQSRRDQAIPAAEALMWSLQPSSLIGLLLPTLDADTSLAIGLRLLLTREVPFLLSPYIGVIAVLGSCCWFRVARTKERAITLALIGFSLLFAFGSYTPIYTFLYTWVPILHVMRFPEKYYYLTFALLVFITVRGLRQVDDNEKSHTPWILATSILAAWLVTYVTFRIRPQLLWDIVQPRYPGTAYLATNLTTIATILVILEKQIAISLTLALLFGLNRLGLLRGTLFRPLLVVTIFLDLSSANKPLHFLRDENVVQSAARIIEQPPADHGRLFYYPPGNNLHPGFIWIAANPTYEKATEIVQDNLLPNAGMLYGFEYFQDIDALSRRSYTNFLNFINALPVDHRGKLLRALNVKYVVAFHQLNVPGLKFIREFPEHYSRLYEVTDAVPRAYLVSRGIYDQDPISTLRRIASDDFDPLHEVVLDAPTRVTRQFSFRGDARIKLYQNDQVQINAQLNEPGILVLTDAFYPGWKVFVDGKEQRILRANYLFRGVELAAGNHRVEFVYDPLSFKIGWIISLLTAAALISISLASLVRGRLHCRQSTDTVSTEPAHAVLD